MEAYGQSLKEYPNEYPDDPHPHAVAGEGGRVVAQFTDIDDARMFAAAPDMRKSLDTFPDEPTDIDTEDGARAYIESIRLWREDTPTK